MLPVINGFCVEQAVRTGLGLKAAINRFSRFDRKNYFYPDLPQGYQISQLYHPIVGEGEVLVDLGPGVARKVRIDHIHLEQDAGKSIHDLDPDLSYVDLNRTGVALMEIVSRPDIRGPEEAAEYVRKLRQILRYLGTCDGNMQEGNLRADVNVSVRPKGATALGTRCEIKNMNSMRFISRRSSTRPAGRSRILEDGGTVEQETRLYDPNKGETRSMRSKEEAHDYRYFPDPDLLPLELDQAWIDAIGAGLPELPDAKKARFVADYGMTEYDAGVLTAEAASAGYFEAVARGPRRQAGGELGDQRALRPAEQGGPAASRRARSAPAQLGGLIDLVGSGEISGKIAKDVFEILWTEGGDPATIVAERGLRQVTDTGAIEAAVDAVMAANPDKVAQARGQAVAGRLVRRPGDEGDRRQGQSAGGECAGEGEARDRVRPARSGGGTMTHYDYKVVPAPKRAKRVRGVHGAEDLFALTLTDAINEVARQGWEYVRAEHLPAEAPRGWFRGGTAGEQTVLVFRRAREALGPRLAAVRAEPARSDAIPEVGPVERAAVERLRHREPLRVEPRFGEASDFTPLRPSTRHDDDEPTAPRPAGSARPRSPDRARCLRRVGWRAPTTRLRAPRSKRPSPPCTSLPASESERRSASRSRPSGSSASPSDSAGIRVSEAGSRASG